MNELIVYPLKVLRKFYAKFLGSVPEIPNCEKNPETASQIIYESLMDDKPCMIARFGANELSVLVNYNSINSKSRSILKYIKGEEFDWWWNDGVVECLNKNAGFFPPREDKIEQFCELMIQDIPQVDILGSWLVEENEVENLLKAKKIHLRFLEPFWSTIPWTKALIDKKVLVIHPFASSIQSQYEKRDLLFTNNEILPSFKSLTVIQAVQSLGKGDDRFTDWFEALQFMQAQMNQVDYDVCLVGAGAYGFHLAAHAKRMGKKGFHVGGALQLLFGIKGKRWEDVNYGVIEWGIPSGSYATLMNENWVRPKANETPQNATDVEGACYW